MVSNLDDAIIWPLYIYPKENDGSRLPYGAGDRQPNLSKDFTRALSGGMRLAFVSQGRGNLDSDFGPEDVLQYMYAVLYCPNYRERFAEFLNRDFPRVPLTTDKKLFAALAEKGAELISLHLMESPALGKFVTKYEQPGEHEVVKVRYAEPNARAGIKAGRVYINDAQYFEGVPQNVWEFHIGGYQVCEKWLKDRKGRKLSSDDIDHYQKIVVALNETIRIMREIDEIVPGWPPP